MSDTKMNNSQFDASKAAEAIDAILGPDEEMIDDELASKILESHGIEEARLLANLKENIQKELNEIEEDNKQAKNLRKTLSSISEYQKARSPDALSPKEWISQSINQMEPPLKARAAFSFRNRKEGTMSDADKQILDDLEAELNNEDE